ncbi:MAG TPA: MFS transporter [Pseudolabrys sp.]|nr:MFS transporter [Pseudolabrys sp.]
MPSIPSPSQPNGRRYTLFVLTVLSAMNQLDRQLINILIEPIRREFSLSDLQIGFLVGLVFVTIYSALSIPAAVVAARYSRRNLLFASAAVWGAMTLMCGFAQSYWHLLLARFGVGIGEAGGMPPSHSMISDLYRPHERATALSTWAAGINGGIFFAFLFGGMIGQLYGWRWALIAAGLLTVILSIVLRLTVREVPRGGTTQTQSSAPATSVALLRSTLGQMFRDSTIRNITIGATLACIVGSASLAWIPSFLVRSHGMSIASVGVYLAVLVGVGGAAGTWFSGAASDWLRKRDLRWSMWLIAAILIVTKPFAFGFFFVENTTIALTLFTIPAIFGAAYVGTSIAVLHNRIDGEMRPMASALFLLIVNFIGFGFGPLLVGALSDMTTGRWGTDALRYALVISQGVAIWGALHYYIAGRELARGRWRAGQCVADV